jgi:hypothetical protein
LLAAVEKVSLVSAAYLRGPLTLQVPLLGYRFVNCVLLPVPSLSLAKCYSKALGVVERRRGGRRGIIKYKRREGSGTTKSKSRKLLKRKSQSIVEMRDGRQTSDE